MTATQKTRVKKLRGLGFVFPEIARVTGVPLAEIRALFRGEARARSYDKEADGVRARAIRELRSEGYSEAAIVACFGEIET